MRKQKQGEESAWGGDSEKWLGSGYTLSVKPKKCIKPYWWIGHTAQEKEGAKGDVGFAGIAFIEMENQVRRENQKFGFGHKV